ncbi:MAG: hypothetical protein AAGE94_15165 [Acidobacteriota bacterium]
MSNDRRDALRRRTADARRRHEQAAPASGRAVDGELFVLAATAEQPVEWAVIDTPSPDRRLVVPFDGQPMIGSRDVAVQQPDAGDENVGGATRGPGGLRCGFPLDVDAPTLLDGRCTGRVAREPVRRARSISRQLAAGQAVGTAIGREVDTEPEYRAWIEEVVAPAHDALRRVSRPAIEPIEAVVEPASVVSRSWWPLAAVLLLAVGLALGWRVFDLQGQRLALQDELAAARQPVDALRASEAELRRRLTDADAERERLRQQLDEATREPTRPILDALVDVPMAVFATALARGEPEVLTVSTADPWISLVIQLDEPDASGRDVALTIARLADGTEVWSHRNLTASRGLLNVLLPSAILPPGAYRVDCLRGSTSIASFRLIVERP